VGLWFDHADSRIKRVTETAAATEAVTAYSDTTGLWKTRPTIRELAGTFLRRRAAGCFLFIGTTGCPLLLFCCKKSLEIIRQHELFKSDRVGAILSAVNLFQERIHDQRHPGFISIPCRCATIPGTSHSHCTRTLLCMSRKESREAPVHIPPIDPDCGGRNELEPSRHVFRVDKRFAHVNNRPRCFENGLHCTEGCL